MSNIPQKINNYLEYVNFQDSLWKAYSSVFQDQESIEVRKALSDIYEKLKCHLEAAYYKKLAGRGLLSEQEIEALKIKLLASVKA